MHAYSWPQVTPFSGGVAIVSPDFSLSAIWKPNSSEQHHENKRVQGKLGCYTQTLFYVTPPPLCLWLKISGYWWQEKPLNLTSKFAPSRGVFLYISFDMYSPSYRVRKPGCPVRRKFVNLNPILKVRLREFVKLHLPLSGLAHPSIRRQKCPVPPVDCILNRRHLLLHRGAGCILPWCRRPCL